MIAKTMKSHVYSRVASRMKNIRLKDIRLARRMQTQLIDPNSDITLLSIAMACSSHDSDRASLINSVHGSCHILYPLNPHLIFIGTYHSRIREFVSQNYNFHE